MYIVLFLIVSFQQPCALGWARLENDLPILTW